VHRNRVVLFYFFLLAAAGGKDYLLIEMESRPHWAVDGCTTLPFLFISDLARQI
jgi:hypothetical protein